MIKKWVAEAVYLAAVLIILCCFVREKKEAIVVNGAGDSVLTADGSEQKESSENGDEGTETEPGEIDTEAQNPNENEKINNSEIGNREEVPPENVMKEDNSGNKIGSVKISNENYEQYDNTTHAWWFKRKNDHSPSGSGEAFSIEQYGGYYLDRAATEEDKVIYLTFDCGYENGFTPGILDTLAEQKVKALFFVTKDFVVKNTEYVVRMKEEGHLVGNHTVRHLSSPVLTPEELMTELDEVAQTMYVLTGYHMDPFFRPPMGEYSERTLKASQDLGYSSLFWSIAYYDYDVNDQPGKDYVIDHFKTYHHNGAVILMHNTSQSNAEALKEVIELLKEEGYRFGEVGEMTVKAE